MVALDVDGTLGNWYFHFKAFALDYWGRRHPDPFRPYHGDMEFDEFLGLTKAEYREAKLAFRQGGLKRWLPVYDDTEEFVRVVNDLPVEIWVATTRPWASVQNIDPDTREWLRRIGLRVDGLLYGDNKYHQLIEQIDQDRIVGVVDDLTEQVELAAGLRLPVVQVARLHNHCNSSKVVPRLGLREAGYWLTEQTERWERTYAS